MFLFKKKRRENIIKLGKRNLKPRTGRKLLPLCLASILVAVTARLFIITFYALSTIMFSDFCPTLPTSNLPL